MDAEQTYLPEPYFPAEQAIHCRSEALEQVPVISKPLEQLVRHALVQTHMHEGNSSGASTD
jgi:hypothetical protein